MNARIATSMVLLSAMLLAGCSPERDCRDAIKLAKPRVYGAINTGANQEANEQISQAYADVAEAEELAVAGDFKGCIEKVNSARVLLNKSQRN